jgi:hypothetical protein
MGEVPSRTPSLGEMLAQIVKGVSTPPTACGLPSKPFSFSLPPGPVARDAVGRRPYSELELDLFWSAAKQVPPLSPELWRLDFAGRLMFRRDYGDRKSPFGWEVDHEVPVQFGGNDFFWNLRAVNWRTNLDRNGRNLLGWLMNLGEILSPSLK